MNYMRKNRAIQQSLSLTESGGQIIIATSSKQGVPHTMTGAHISSLSGGRVRQVTDSAMANGYSPLDQHDSVPQVEREPVFAVERVLEFRKAPHNDREL